MTEWQFRHNRTYRSAVKDDTQAPAMGEVTEEMVEAAAIARFTRLHGPWDLANEHSKRSFRAGARLDLEAAYPLIAQRERARGIREGTRPFIKLFHTDEDTVDVMKVREAWDEAEALAAALSQSPPTQKTKDTA